MNPKDLDKFLQEHLDLKPPKSNGNPEPKKRYRKKTPKVYNAQWVPKQRVVACGECQLPVVNPHSTLLYQNGKWIKQCRICLYKIVVSKPCAK